MTEQQLYQFLRTIDKGATLDKAISIVNSKTLSDSQKVDKIWQMVIEEIIKQLLDNHISNGGQK